MNVALCTAVGTAQQNAGQRTPLDAGFGRCIQQAFNNTVAVMY